MNKLMNIPGILALTALLVFGLPAHRTQAQPAVSVSLNLFYNELAPYGQWISHGSYGRVWRPNIGGDFRPYYTNGYWAMTEYGNTWVSNYDWGWAPFHYGRWAYDPYYGWVWLPDVHWGPAWVSWRSGGGYYGWAPMGPNISISVAIGPSYRAPNDWWVFVPQRYVMDRHFQRHYHGPRNNTVIINKTTIINNTYVQNNNRYIYGPRRQDVERATGRKVAVRNVQSQQSPRRTTVSGNTVQIYRPGAEPGNGNTQGPRRSANPGGNVRQDQTVRSQNATPRTNQFSAPSRGETPAVTTRQTVPGGNDRGQIQAPVTGPRASQPVRQMNNPQQVRSQEPARVSTPERPQAMPQQRQRNPEYRQTNSRPAPTREYQAPAAGRQPSGSNPYSGGGAQPSRPAMNQSPREPQRINMQQRAPQQMRSEPAQRNSNRPGATASNGHGR